MIYDDFFYYWYDRKLTGAEKKQIENRLREYHYLFDTDPLQKHKKEHIETALKCLREDEKELVKVKYFDRSKPNDIKATMILQMSNSRYYRLKKSALEKMARALNII